MARHTFRPPQQEKRGLLGDSPGSHCQSHQQMIATNIVDKVQVPATIEPGDYLISWRWVRVHHLCLSLAWMSWR